MKNYFLLALCFFITQSNSIAEASCGTQTQCRENKNANGEIEGEQTCVNFYKKDVVIVKAHYRAGKLDGDFFCADDDGIPVQQGHYKDGTLDGPNKEYDSSLKVWALEENYRTGKREGISRRRTQNGEIIKFFKNDQQYGYEIHVDKNGKLVSKLNCSVEGVRKDAHICDSISIPGYETLLGAQVVAEKAKLKPVLEKEVVEQKFKNGHVQVQSFYEKGQKVEEKIFFEEGQLKSDTFLKKGFWAYKIAEYYQNGKLKSEVLENDSGEALTAADFKTYYDNGRLKAKGRRMIDERSYWGEGIYDGEIQQFSDDGKPSDIEYYKDGKPTGNWKSYRKKCDFETVYNNGNPVSETTFAKDTRDVLIKVEYMPDGSKKSESKKPGLKDNFCKD